VTAPDFLVALYAAVEAVRAGEVKVDLVHTTETDGVVETLSVTVRRTVERRVDAPSREGGDG
jgi:hypothetical protein